MNALIGCTVGQHQRRREAKVAFAKRKDMQYSKQKEATRRIQQIDNPEILMEEPDR